MGLFDFSEVNIIEILSFIATAAIGYAAVRISRLSSKHEKEMRRLENRIAINDKIYNIYHSLLREVVTADFLNDHNITKLQKLYELDYESSFLFNEETSGLIHSIILDFYNIFSFNTYPVYDDKEIGTVELKISKSLDNPQQFIFITIIHKKLEKIFKPYKLNI
ncbi:MAG: hypothetical protein ACYCX2_02105 [Christensenellales bacterium]